MSVQDVVVGPMIVRRTYLAMLKGYFARTVHPISAHLDNRRRANPVVAGLSARLETGHYAIILGRRVRIRVVA